jgi:hypothetical protein
MGKARLSQEGVVFALAVAMFAVFAVTLNNFLTAGNLIALVRSVSTYGSEPVSEHAGEAGIQSRRQRLKAGIELAGVSKNAGRH